MMSVTPKIDQLVDAQDFRIKNFLYRTPLHIDVEQTRAAVETLVDALGVRPNLEYSLNKLTRYALNLTSATSSDTEAATANRNCACHTTVNFAEFTNLIDIVKNTHIENVINTVEDFHMATYNKPLVGRHQLVWSLPGYCDYPLHRDRHTTHRYHIPLQTTKEFYFIVEDEGVQYKLHLPSDGGVWYLASRDVTHTIRHFGTTPRLHLLLTSSV